MQIFVGANGMLQVTKQEQENTFMKIQKKEDYYH